MVRRSVLLVAVAAAAGVLATTAVTRAGGGAAPPAAEVPTSTAGVVTTTLTSRQQVNGTLGYAAPATLVAPQGSTPQQVAQARASANSAYVALQNARTAQSHTDTSGSHGQQAADQAQAAVDAAQAQSYGAWTQLQSALETEAVPAGILTWLPAPGATISQGQRLYEVSRQPVPLFYGAQPMYRHLGIGASGADVTELEDNLLALGFGSGGRLVADGIYTAADSAAVRDWQAAIGAPVTGELDLGAVVLLPGAVRVAALHAAAGGAYAPGQPMLDVTDTSHVVTVALDTSLVAHVKVGDGVTVVLPTSAQPATGKVVDVSGVAQVPTGNQNGPVRATVPITIRLDDPAAGGGLDQVPVRVAITDQVRSNVLAVPVTALVARSDGTFAVEVVRPAGRTSVTVRIGIFGDNGLVEVSGTGLAAGDLVEVPKPL